MFARKLMLNKLGVYCRIKKNDFLIKKKKKETGNNWGNRMVCVVALLAACRTDLYRHRAPLVITLLTLRPTQHSLSSYSTNCRLVGCLWSGAPYTSPLRASENSKRSWKSWLSLSWISFADTDHLQNEKRNHLTVKNKRLMLG